jgi:hypothetical protein
MKKGGKLKNICVGVRLASLDKNIKTHLLSFLLTPS